MGRDDQFERFLGNVRGLDERRQREFAALNAQGPYVVGAQFWSVAAGSDVRYAPFEQCACKEAAYWDPVFNGIILSAPEGDAEFAGFKARARKAYEHYWQVRDRLWRAIATVDRPAMQAVYEFVDDVTWLAQGFQDGDPVPAYVEAPDVLLRGLSALGSYEAPQITDDVILAQVESLGVDDLKQICREHGLKVGGKKGELLGRVRGSVPVEALRRILSALSPAKLVSVRRRAFIVLCVDWLVKQHLSKCIGEDLCRYDPGWQEHYQYYVITKGDGVPCPQCAALHGQPLAYRAGSPRPPLHPGCDCEEEGYEDPAERAAREEQLRRLGISLRVERG